MQLIAELESHKRGVYAGSIAYLDFWGNLDSCIAIRTVVKKGNTYFVQAGAGIVADSDPTREYNETKSKALAAMQAVMGK
jgi:anthranilate synthase component 1